MTIFSFKASYLIVTGFIFSLEVIIALFIHDNLIRPYFGDVLASIMVYTFLRGTLNCSILKSAIISLCISYFIEFLQYFRAIDTLGLSQYKLIRIVFGSSFEWLDMLAYTTGICLVLAFEGLVLSKRITNV